MTHAITIGDLVLFFALLIGVAFIAFMYEIWIDSDGSWMKRRMSRLSTLTSTDRTCADCGKRESCDDDCPNATLAMHDGKQP